MKNDLTPLTEGIHIDASPQSWTHERFRNRWVLRGLQPIRVRFLRSDRLDEWLVGKEYNNNEGNACRLRVPEPFNAHFNDGPESGLYLLREYLGIDGDHERVLAELYTRKKIWSLLQVERLILDFERGINPLKLDTDRWWVFFIHAPRAFTQLHVKRFDKTWVVELNYPPYTRLDSCQDILFLN